MVIVFFAAKVQQNFGIYKPLRRKKQIYLSFYVVKACYSLERAIVASRWDGLAVSVSSKVPFQNFWKKVLFKRNYGQNNYFSHFFAKLFGYFKKKSYLCTVIE